MSMLLSRAMPLPPTLVALASRYAYVAMMPSFDTPLLFFFADTTIHFCRWTYKIYCFSDELP